MDDPILHPIPVGISAGELRKLHKDAGGKKRLASYVRGKLDLPERKRGRPKKATPAKPKRKA